MSSKKYRPWDPDQAFLFPPAMCDWLEEDHLVYRLLDVVESLDMRSISHSIHAKDARGVRPCNPRMMLALLLYSRRKVIVEPVFVHIKESRGFRRFSLRGVFKVRA